jgi:2-amino-4-hydroxy-6-hydroxymethyldihydropteridine diphosphokinase
LLQALPHSTVLEQSSLYQSRAWGNLRAGSYLNAAALLQTTLLPGVLLQRLLDIEYACGRRRHRKRWGKRAVDIDVLLLGNLRLHSSRLQVPHPWFWQREFALLPALEVLRSVLQQDDDENRVIAVPRTWPGKTARHWRQVGGFHLSRPLRILSVDS